MFYGYAVVMTETLSSRDFRAHLSDAIDRARAGDTTVVTRNGRAVGAFVPMEVLERARRQEEAELRRLIEERKDSPTVPMSEVMAETLERDE
jgi:prevent-host-death family protein